MNCCCHNYCKVNRNLNLQLKRTICICWLRENGVPIQWDFNLLKIQQIKNGIKFSLNYFADCKATYQVPKAYKVKLHTKSL